MSCDDDEFEDFMSKVDKIGELVRKLKSANRSDELENATREADDYLQQRSSEKAKINLETSFGHDLVTESETLDNRRDGHLDAMSPDEFMKKVTEDAKKRSADKKDRKACSDMYKKEANIAFRTGDHIKALHLYNKAIEEVRDSCVLYTNRALTQLHLGCYTKVQEDCKAALRINPASLKALVYQARAYRALGQFELAEACTQEATNLHPHHKAFIRHSVLKELQIVSEKP